MLSSGILVGVDEATQGVPQRCVFPRRGGRAERGITAEMFRSFYTPCLGRYGMLCYSCLCHRYFVV